MFLYRFTTSGITAAGDLSLNTNNIAGSLCYQVFVKSSSSNTVFDFKIIDKYDHPIKGFTNQTNLINDLTPFPIEGMCTLMLENATHDEPFDIMICCLEK